MNKFKEIVKYVFWGGITTIVNWVVYALLTMCFQIMPVISNIVAWIISVIVAYFSNKIYVFKNNNEKSGIQFFAFLSSRLFTGIIETAGLPILIKALSLDPFLGIKSFGEKLIISILVVIINYILSKYIIFREKKR